MKIQEEINTFARVEDKPVLLWLFKKYYMASQWNFVAKCKHVSYGDQSYQTHRVWNPTPEGQIIYDNYLSKHNEMSLTIKINLENDEAVQADQAAELPALVASQLRTLAFRLEQDYAFFNGYSLPVFDGNGNKIGSLVVENVHE